MKILKAYNFDLEKQKLEYFLQHNNNLIDYTNINKYVEDLLFRMSGGTLQKIHMVEYPAFLDLKITNGAINEIVKRVCTYNLYKKTLFNLKKIFLYQICLSPPIINYNNYKEYRHISIRYTT